MSELMMITGTSGPLERVRRRSSRELLDRSSLAIDATAEGREELVTVVAGRRESDASWREILLGLKQHRLDIPPNLAVGADAMGFWMALSKVCASTWHQRCGVRKTTDLLSRLPKSVPAPSKEKTQALWMAETQLEEPVRAGVPGEEARRLELWHPTRLPEVGRPSPSFRPEENPNPEVRPLAEVVRTGRFEGGTQKAT